MIEMEFTPGDMATVSDVALSRFEKYKNIPSNYGTSRNFEKDFAGAAGEYAFAWTFGLDWTGRDDDSIADVGDYEVRTRRGQGRLCLHDKEIERKKLAAGQKYVLCWWEPNTLTIVGWAYASEILRAGLHYEGRHYIPTNKLHSIETVLL